MKNQALVAAISGLLIGGVGFTNKINILQVSGFGLLISSVAVPLTKDSKKTDPEIIDTTPETPENPELPETEKLSKKIIIKNKSLNKTEPKKPELTEKTTTKLLPRPIHPYQTYKSVEKPILKVK